MALRRSVHHGGAIAAVFFAVACGSSTAPHGNNNPHPGISFLAGNQQSDTVQSTLNQALVVQVSSGGAPAANQIVQFVAVGAADSTHAIGGDWVDVAPLSSDFPTNFVAETTNTRGEVTVGVFLGARAGTAPLIVKVPAFGYIDTARFNVTAGGAASLRSGPADTTVYLNSTVNLHTTVVDRFGNPRTDPVTYTLVSGPAHLSGSQVTVTGFGRVLVTATAHNITDSSYISGIPSGTMAASLDNGGIAVFNLDGSNFKTITTMAAGTVAWAPSGSNLVFDQTYAGGTAGGTASLFAATTGGSVSLLDNSGGPTDAWPAYSRDGTWIYYVKITGGGDLWRVHPDGTGDAAVPMQAGSPLVQFPSPSPDGTQIVYVVEGSATVEILNVSSGVSTPLGSLAAFSTAWAPSGNVIAYAVNGAIGTIHSDGTGQTTITSGPYEAQIAWSPDGNWIAARNVATRKIDLISVTTPNLILPLGFTGAMDSPTWH